MAKRKLPKLSEKRAANVTTSWVLALRRKDEWQATAAKPIRVYKVEVPGKDTVYAVAPGRVEAAGYVALQLELVSEPQEQADTLAAAKKQLEELRAYIEAQERIMDSPQQPHNLNKDCQSGQSLP